MANRQHVFKIVHRLYNYIVDCHILHMSLYDVRGVCDIELNLDLAHSGGLDPPAWLLGGFDLTCNASSSYHHS